MKYYVRSRSKSRAVADRKARKQVRRLCGKLRTDVSCLLEAEARKGTKQAVEQALELERTEFLGRPHYEHTAAKVKRGYRNGYSARTITTGSGAVDIDMPKVCGGQELFESQILPPYMRTASSLLTAFPELYLGGLSGGDFRPALNALLGSQAPLSDSSIARLRQQWHESHLTWHEQPLETHYAYVYADGIYMKVGRAGEKLALLVLLGVDRQGQKNLLAVLPGYRESYEAWQRVLRNLMQRGVQWIGLFIADGIASFWRAAGEVFPEAKHQRDWVHRMRNVLGLLPQDKRFQVRALNDLQKIYNAGTRQESYQRFADFARKYAAYPSAVKCLLETREDLTRYFDFPREHWVHLKTSNPIESSFSPVRARLNKVRRMVLESSVLGLVFHLLLKRQARWHRISCPALAALVIHGTRYRNGIAIMSATKSKVA